MKNKHKGFSMIELIIAIAIIGIFTGLGSISFGYIRAGNVRSATKTVDSNLSRLRLDTMSKASKPYMYLYKLGNDYYMYCTNSTSVDTSVANGTKIANDSIMIKVDGVPLSSANSPCKIGFQKGSGAFLSGTPQKISFSDSDGQGTIYDLIIVNETGKHYIKTS